MISRTLDADAVRLHVRQAAQMELVPFRAWVLDGAPQIVAWLDEIGDGAASRPAARGVESVLDVLRHLVPMRRRLARVCQSLGHGAIPSPEHRTIATLPSMAWARMGLDASQEELRDTLESLWPMTDLDLETDAFGIGPYNVKEWLSWQRLHDDEHLAEIEHSAYLLGIHGARDRSAA